MSCILCHQGIQLRLAYSLARPAILPAGKGRGGMSYVPSFEGWRGILLLGHWSVCPAKQIILGAFGYLIPSKLNQLGKTVFSFLSPNQYVQGI